MTSKEGKELCVQKVPLFSELARQEQETIESLLVRRQVKEGEIISEPGGEKQLAIIEQGRAALYQLDSNGKQQLLRIINSGDYVGESWLLGNDNTDNYVEAVEESVICFLSQSDFNSILERHFAIAKVVLKTQAKIVTSLKKQVHLLAVTPFKLRLLTYLEGLHRKQCQDEVRLPANFKDVASYLGTTPETLSRNLKALKKQGLIDYKGHTIIFKEK